MKYFQFGADSKNIRTATPDWDLQGPGCRFDFDRVTREVCVDRAERSNTRGKEACAMPLAVCRGWSSCWATVTILIMSEC